MATAVAFVDSEMPRKVKPFCFLVLVGKLCISLYILVYQSLFEQDLMRR